MSQANFSVTLSKVAQNGRASRDYGIWAGKTGGESTAEVSDYYPGAMQPAIKEKATPTTSDLTIRKREEDLTDADVAELYVDLASPDTILTCVVQRMTAADRTQGAPRSYRCVVMGVTPPDTDSSSGDTAELSVTLSVFGLPTIAA